MSLFAHQREGAALLAARPHAYLGDPPGMGKTRTLLHALTLAGAERPVVFCPAIVRSHWQRESEIVRGDAPIQITSYDRAVMGHYGLMREAIVTYKADALILDEAHYLKHATAIRTKILLGPNGYARRVPRVWCASGTPVPRHPGELWTVLSSLFPEVALAHGLTTRREFDARFCVTKGRLVQHVWREKVVGMKNEAEFRTILDAILVRRPAQADVPPVWWQMLPLDASDYGMQEEDALLEAGRARTDYEEWIVDMAASPHVARYRRHVGEAKVKPVVEQVAHELQTGDEKVVLFAHHRSVLQALANALHTFGVARIDGDVSHARREELRTRFMEDPSCRVFIGQNQACGTGFDGLQYAASRCLLVEPSWVREENVQLAARLARTGQRHWPVRAQMVTLAGTLDEWIVAQNHREAEMHQRMFEEKAV